MAVSDRAAAAGTFAMQLRNNKNVQNSAQRVAGSSRAVYRRARRKDVREAATDRKLWRRMGEALTSAGALLGAVSETPPKPKRRWPWWVAGGVVVGAGAWLASNESARSRIQKMAGQGEAEEEAGAIPDAGAAQVDGTQPVVV
ncbi:MAG: hypothetical protein WAL22_05570 [Solirubrobacteraceae bacterium]